MTNAVFNVETFKAGALKNGLIRGNKFTIDLPVPKGLRQQKFNTASDRFQMNATGTSLRLFCMSTSLPGVGFATSENRPLGYGPWQRQPHTPMFQEMHLMFYLDGNGDVFNYFSAWMKLISNFDSRNAASSGAAATGILTNQYPYELAYTDEYVVDAVVSIYSDSGKKNNGQEGPVIVNTYRDAWPMFMGQTKLGWDQKNQILMLPMIFGFFDWYPEPLFVNVNNTV